MPMETLIATGKRSNLLARGTVTHSSEDTDFPWENAWDGRGRTPGAFAAAGLNDYLRVDLDEVPDPGFEVAALTAWTTATNGAGNTAALATDQKNAGAKSLKLHLAAAGAGNYALGQVDLEEIPSGERRTIQAALRGDGTVYCRVRAYIPELGLYLTPAAAWTATPTDLWTQQTASWTALTTTMLTFVMPTYAASARALLTLRIIAYAEEASSTGDAWVDDVACWASMSFLGVHGHELGPVAPQWRHSTDGFAASDDLVLALTIAEGKFYGYSATPSDRRYQELLLSGTNHEAAAFGEVGFCQAYAHERYGMDSLTTTEGLAQERLEAPDGVVAVIALAQRPTTSKELALAWPTETNFLAWLREVARRSEYGRWPAWFVLDSDSADVLFCCLPKDLVDALELVGVHRASSKIQVTEQPFPIWY
jgi:hypothetical protein